MRDNLLPCRDCSPDQTDYLDAIDLGGFKEDLAEPASIGAAAVSCRGWVCERLVLEASVKEPEQDPMTVSVNSFCGGWQSGMGVSIVIDRA